MKSLSYTLLTAAFVVLSACGKGSDSSGTTTAVVPDPAAGQCGVGSVYTGQGCLAQGSCQASYGWNGSTCIQGTLYNGANGQCGVGSVYTAQGCLAQANCPASFGWNGSTCIQGTVTGYNTGYNGYNGYNQYNQYNQYNTGYYNNYNNYGGYYYNNGYFRKRPSVGFYFGFGY